MARRVIAGLAWIVLGFSVGLATPLVVLMPFGYRSLAVLSGSMAPALETGDQILAKRTAPSELRVGDVVTFEDPTRGSLVTHRVRSLVSDGGTVRVVTRGDANEAPERWSVAASGSVGRAVLRVPLMGYVTVAAGTPLGRALLVVLPALVLAGCELRRTWRRRSDEAAQVSATDADAWTSTTVRAHRTQLDTKDGRTT